MPIKVKELKDDAVFDIKVNKPFYYMVKAASYHIVANITATDKDSYFKEIITKKYEDLDDTQRTFYTMALLLAEIERQASQNNLIVEKEVLQPGDEGYVEPKLD